MMIAANEITLSIPRGRATAFFRDPNGLNHQQLISYRRGIAERLNDRLFDLDILTARVEERASVTKNLQKYAKSMGVQLKIDWFF